MTTQEWQTLIALIIGVSSIAGIIFGIIRFYIRVFAKQELEEQLEEIKHELKPNSGSSLKDQVTRLEDSVKRLEIEHMMLRENQEKTHESLQNQESKITKIYDTLIDYVTHNTHR